MNTSRIASGALAVALAFGATACDADGTTASDGFGGVEEGQGTFDDGLDDGPNDDGGLDDGTTDTTG